MPIGTRHGTTPWETREIAESCGICLTSSTRKVRAFEERLAFILRACRALDPHARPCDLVAMVVATLETGGRLASVDRDRLRGRVRELIDAAG